MEKVLAKREVKKKVKSISVNKFKKRMLAWDSPVEYVNNMYGCHPNDNNEEYFKKIFTE